MTCWRDDRPAYRLRDDSRPTTNRMKRLMVPQPDALSLRPLGAALAVQVVVMAGVVALVGSHGWDDGAITLAFSQSFAETGRIALTAASEQVEGFSSVTWFLINACFSLFHPGFIGAIRASQLAAAAFLALATVFVWLIGRDLRLRPGTLWLVLILFSVLGPSITEVANGMEMTLLAASGLALIYALYHRDDPALQAIALIVFLSTRFEAMVYVPVMLAPLLWRRRVGTFLRLAALAGLVVGVETGARLLIFGDLMPNTIYAKMQPVYLKSGIGAVRSRLYAAAEIPLVVLPLVLAASGLGVWAWRGGTAGRRCLAGLLADGAVLAAPIVAVEAFAVLTGKNWGYVGRMEFLAFPFVLLLFGLSWDRFAAFAPRASALLVVASLMTVPVSWYQSAGEPLVNIARVLRGESRGVTESLAVISSRSRVTPARYRITGEAVDRLRQRLGLDTITFATPDVGGVGLCCRRIRVVDIALLTNRTLAHEGYGALPAVLAGENPDVVRVGGIWAAGSGLYDLPEFNAHFQVVLIDCARFYLRDDHVQSLLQRRQAVLHPITDLPCRVPANRDAADPPGSRLVYDRAFSRPDRVLVIADQGTSCCRD